jgi:hypothetical protein
MGERTQYTPGTFSWVDLATTDPDAAKTFYSGLFGWQAEDMPVPGDGYYSMQSIGGKHVAAIAGQPPPMQAAGAPPAWQSYITVENADEVAQRAAELGATVAMPPFDVMESGRMGVIQDPQGAFFMIWEPRQHIGAALVNAPGAFCWNELASPDLDAAPGFYSELFGWVAEPFEGSEMPYLTIRNGEHVNGGMRGKQPMEPPYWLVYFAVDDIDAGMAKVGELGGQTIAGPYDLPMAKIAVVQDPQGAVFALYAGALED